MELFSVACITCRAKIQVRSVSAIGQVLACPRCGGMVEISAPPGWKPPPKAARLPTAKDSTAKDPATKATPTKDTPPETSHPATAANSSGEASGHPKPQSGATAGDPGSTYVAEPVLDDDDPLAAVAREAAERSRKQRKLLAIGGGVAGLALVAAVIRLATSGPAEVVVVPNGEAPAAVATGTKPVPSATPPAPSAPRTTNPMPTPTPQPSPSTSPPSPSATPTATPAATSIATAPPTPIAIPGGTPVPSGTVVARVEPPPTNPPAVVPSVIIPLAPRRGAPPPSPEVAKRLAAKAPAVELVGLTRREALEFVGKLAAVGVQYEWDTLAPADLKLDEQIKLKVGDSTYEGLLTQLVEPVGARVELVGSSLLVRPVVAAAAVDYPIDDLGGGELAAAELYAALVQLFVDPESWEGRGGRGKLTAAAGKLTATQTSVVQRELLAWLDRLRAARGKSTVGPPQSNDSRVLRAKASLEKPVTMNFRPGVPLVEILAYLEKKTGTALTLDYLALADAGYTPDEVIGVAADKTPLGEVLAAICEPRELDYRIVDERTFEITTREALRRRAYVEFYDIRPLIAAEISPIELIKQLKTQFAAAGWQEAGGEGVARFDAASNRLILRQHQDAQRRIERFLGELIAEVARVKAGAPAAAPAGVSPAASPAATPLTAPRPSGPIMLPASRPGAKPSGSQPGGLQPSGLQPGGSQPAGASR